MEPIPQPPGYPWIGNLLSLGGANPLETMMNLLKPYGEIASVTVFGIRVVFISSAAILTELCDEKRFEKAVEGPVASLRDVVNDGLFTARNGELNWGIAHRVLTPAFGPLYVQGMFDDMKDISAQLVLKWARHGESFKIPVTDDFTRLTLDTIALCSMNYRFNSFYTEKVHHFVNALMYVLKQSQGREIRPKWWRAISPWEREFFRQTALMRELANDMVQERLKNPTETKDLLNAMILSKDPKTGKQLDDESIIDNLITFLAAGHETTSGMLSFTFHYLLKNPDTFRKAQREVDEVIGTEPVRYEHLNKLPYLNAVLRESSRLQPTAPGMAVKPLSPDGEVVGGKYHLTAKDRIIAIFPRVHRDPEVYGDDAEAFRPERMLDEEFEKLAPNAWKPFGNGARGCIGRGFAWQEMLLVSAMLLQYFNLESYDRDYELDVVSTLTIKPKDFYMRAVLRPGWTLKSLEASLAGLAAGNNAQNMKRRSADSVSEKSNGQPITILRLQHRDMRGFRTHTRRRRGGPRLRGLAR